jgi:hypothetical protein
MILTLILKSFNYYFIKNYSELNDFFGCCGIWILKDWFNSLVLENCYSHNYNQINNITEILMPKIRKMCDEYPEDSFYCKLLIITPITIIVLFILIIIAIVTCGIVSFVKFRKYKKRYRYHQNLREYEAKNDAISSETKKIEL